MADSENKTSPDSGYEKKDISANKVIFFGVISVLLLVVILVILNDFFTAATEEQKYKAVLQPESAALRDQRALEDETLNSYKLLDSAKGTYQIPIERAMKVMADEAFRAAEDSLKTGKNGK